MLGLTATFAAPAALAGAGAGPACKDAGAPPAAIRELITAEADKQGVEAKLALAVADQESRFGLDLNSKAGARGIMQLMPDTAARFGVEDICDPAENVRGGVSYLKELTREFGGNLFLVLSGYNAGEGRVYEARGVPAIAETVRYVASVSNSYFGFDNSLRGGRRAKASRQMSKPIDTATTDGAGAKWIGGSVLYVEEAKDVETDVR
jgi:soluble lytic murein transglycosylase-like protein